ncbi:uncharacterized protein SCODWIG_01143 [Saccharomycodes ludwigii]|uniref:CAP-Gly domain-containing protein n=1 Tax=Saccharomycodes ludwigii TaxID=36035 RepID=A0A376B441_9ASCO|nr:uncharacterized protein SCODWIG_01143 [Saccharomycodes ludwigii]
MLDNKNNPNIQITSALANFEISKKKLQTWITNGTIPLFNEFYVKTGIEPSNMVIEFYNQGLKTKEITLASDLNNTIDASIIHHITKVKVLDNNPKSTFNVLVQQGNVDDDQLYQLDDSVYKKRTDSVYMWKQSMKAEIESATRQRIDLLKKNLNKGCIVLKDGRKGILRYVGCVSDTVTGANNDSEIWCGVEFSEAVGKNNGCINGQRYFGPVSEKHGGFFKPTSLDLINDNFENDDEL